jgi:HK97 family phage major capsid protein
MTGTISTAFLSRLEAQRENLIAEAEAWTRSLPEGRLTPEQDLRYRNYRSDLQGIAARIRDTKSELQRMGDYALKNTGGVNTATYGRMWATRVAEKLRRSMSRDDGEQRAVVSGSVDIPALVEPDVVDIARPTRLLDILVNRRVADGHAIEYVRQIVRDTQADVVPDGQLKPTSVYTVEAVQDHCRVLAHLSEPTPNRIWADHSNLQSWLTSEMFGGLADALEAQIVAGDGSGENFDGILSVSGTTAVPFATDVPTTLRSAVTALQLIGEVPNAWVMHPSDAQAIDLLRWGTAGGLLTEGYAGGGGEGTSSNIFGSTLQRVVCKSIPPGTAVLADWSKMALYERESANLAIDVGGDLFARNQFICRAEMRAVSAVLRPSAFAVVDLTA